MAVSQDDVDKLGKALGKERTDHKATKLKLSRAVADVDRLNKYIEAQGRENTCSM